jgi:hypothetical protein
MFCDIPPDILQWSSDMLSSMHLSFPSEGSPHSLASVIKKKTAYIYACLLDAV